jgi:aspartyl-tRNA(Asn)/glutamyl-tRNA(Gln) amidotransferase subunit A
LTADELRAAIDDPERRAAVSAVELADAFLERIDETQSSIRAFITVTHDLARADAERVDSARAEGRRLALDGMPVAVKDNIDVGVIRRTVASKFFEHHVAERDAEVVRRIREAGAVVVGKALLHEFVYGATCTNPFYGQCRNPWDLERIPGGSSGGSGAALAADLAIGALGTDTGGSIRIPAHLNGVSGLRPTFGAASNRGIFPISWTFDTVGPMARSMRDVADLYAVMRGYDAFDPRASEALVDEPLEALEEGIEGVRIGVPEPFFFDDLEPEVAQLVRAAADQLAGLGADVFELSLPGAEEAYEICTLMIRADALALHRERLDEHPELFGDDVRERLRLGETITGWEYARMVERMYEWRRDVRLRFRTDVDLILTPTANAVAPPIEGAEMIATTAQLTRFTYPWSLAHMPAVSIPCGFTSEGLPVGVQLGADRYREALLLRAGVAYQAVTDWHRRRPALVGTSRQSSLPRRSST